MLQLRKACGLKSMRAQVSMSFTTVQRRPETPMRLWRKGTRKRDPRLLWVSELSLDGPFRALHSRRTRRCCYPAVIMISSMVARATPGRMRP